MTAPTTYTYRDGEKLPLEKRPDEFVTRIPEEGLSTSRFESTEQVSPASTRVKVEADELDGAMRAMRELAPTHHAYDVAGTGEEFLITDRVLVTFATPLTSGEVDAFAAEYGLLLLEKYGERDYLFQVSEYTGMHLTPDGRGINPVKLVVHLTEKDARVSGAENDLNYRAEKYETTHLPTDPGYLAQWHLHTRTTHPEFDPRASSRCEEAWRLLRGYGSPEVVIGVTDDGCKLDHQDFDLQTKFAGWGYFVGSRLVTRGEPDADPAKMYVTGQNHGTSCAGVAAGEADAALTVGAAPGCRLLPIRWESSGPFLMISDSKILTALNYLADRVDVLSNSWGTVPLSLRASAVVRRVEELGRGGGRRGKGIVFAWAAGNDNCPLRFDGSTPVPYTTGWKPQSTSPVWEGPRTARRFENNLAGVPGVMHVAALASNGQRSHYSNYGEGVTLCAPSSNSHMYGRLAVPGLRVTAATGTGGGVTAGFGGTSSATPLTAGIAALVISADPSLTALQVISLLGRTASKTLTTAGYARTPPAVFDPSPTWDVSPVAPYDRGDFTRAAPDGSWSPWFGYGKVDAAAAVAAALNVAGGARSTLLYESRPARRIPDSDPVGIRDAISVAEVGRVRDVTVELDIRHSYVGDLTVALVGPDGTRAELHRRGGGPADDLRRSYDAASAPALAAFQDRPAAGSWTLEVADAAAVDVGTLNEWALLLTVSPEPAEIADTGPVRIPDGDSRGIVRVLRVPAGRSAQEVAVSVDISHPWTPDLQLSLTPPGGAPIRLFAGRGGSSRDLVQTWRAADLPELRSLLGRDVGGEWRLTVADRVRQDEGTLNRWSVRVQ